MTSITQVYELLNNDTIIANIIESLKVPHPLSLTHIRNDIRKYLSQLRNDLIVIVEDEYVDKVYRDSYYNYYSTKLKNYSRNCIRFSFIEPDIDVSKLYTSEEEREKLLSKYCGFMIIRPIYPGTIGRTAIDPKAFKNTTPLLICKAPINSSIIGIQTTIQAFPHSSQDSEYMTCAETSIWTIMEYFGNKYPEYKPLLPSQIHKLLEIKRDERQFPSKGLNIGNLSFILKSQGFGCKIYAHDEYNDTEFKRIFSCYIESGIPLIVAISSKAGGHAVACIGRKYVDRKIIASVPEQKFNNGISFRYWNDSISYFVFNDDNRPFYQIDPLSAPTPQLGADCSITHFIAPLYHKIYLDAQKAIEYTRILCNNFLDLPDNVTLRTFLAPNRTYQSYIINDSKLSEIHKSLLLNRLHFPKFIWVTEIATYDKFIQREVQSLILLDATEPLSYIMEPLILMCYNEKISFFDTNSLTIKENTLPLRFDCISFNQNLE